MSENLKKLYNTLQNDYGDNFTADYDTFVNDMRDEGKRTRLYQNLRNDYGDNFTRSFDEFSSDIGVSVSTKDEVPLYLQRPDEVAAPVTAFQGQEDPYLRGFIPNVKQGTKGLVEGSRVMAGTTANLFTGSSHDAVRAMEILDKHGADGYNPRRAYRKDLEDKYDAEMAEYEKQMKEWREKHPGVIDRAKSMLPLSGDMPKKPKNPFVSGQTIGETGIVGDRADMRAYRLVEEALKKGGGDPGKAKEYLSGKQGEKTWGDRAEERGTEELGKLKQPKGFAGWVGNLVPQMVPNALAIAASVHPTTRPLSRPLGALGMGMLSTASGGHAIADARQYAKDNDMDIPESDVVKAGLLATAIEVGTEMIPFSRYMSGAAKTVRRRLGKQVSEEILSNKKAVKEVNDLLNRAAKNIPGSLGKKTAVEWAKDLTAESLSEFAAESLDTLVPTLYANREDYPELSAIIANGFEGAKAGLFMGAFLGTGSRLANTYVQNQRRKEQGNVTFADTGKGVVEILGQRGDNFVVLNQNGEVTDIPKDAITDVATVDWAEFKEYADGLKKGEEVTAPETEEARAATNAILESIVNPGLKKGTNPMDQDTHVEARVDLERTRSALDEALKDAKFAFDDRVLTMPMEQQKAFVSDVIRDEALGEEQKQAIVNHIVSFHELRQLEQSRMEAIEADIARVGEANGEMVNETTGTLVSAFLKGSESETPVAITKGMRLKQDEGNPDAPYSIDVENSDEAIYYIDENGATQVATADSFEFYANETVEEATEKYRAYMIEQEEIAQAAIAESVTARLNAPVESPAAPAEETSPTGPGFGDTAVMEDGTSALVVEVHDDGTYTLELELPTGEITETTVPAEELGKFGFEVEEPAPVQPTGQPATEESSATGALSEEAALEREKEQFMASLPVFESGKNAGQIDQSQMTPGQNLRYFEYEVGKEKTAEMAAKQAAILKKKLDRERAKLDNDPFNIALNKDVNALQTEYEAYQMYADQARVEKTRRYMEETKGEPSVVDAQAKEQQLQAEKKEREAIEQAERESLHGVPDILTDTAEKARARGFRSVNGVRVDRQQPLQPVKYTTRERKFGNSATVNVKRAIVDADAMQPSHVNGQRNPFYFISETQPKERTDNASIEARDRIAANINPVEITGGVTAYTGAPIANARGEVIQGNNRTDAIKEMYKSRPESAEKYKAHLVETAGEYNMTPEEVAAMKKPMAVDIADVSDAEAIKLGQLSAADTESGGTQRVPAQQTAVALGTDIGRFSSMLYDGGTEETTMSDLLDVNGKRSLDYLHQKRLINNTQYQSAFDERGNITPEAKRDLQDVSSFVLFDGANDNIKQMFAAIPDKAKRAVLQVLHRDAEVPAKDSIIRDLQEAIEAFYLLRQDQVFDNATNYQSLRIAVEGARRQARMFNTETEFPLEKYSTFALELAVLFKSDTQNALKNRLNGLYNDLQGIDGDIFNAPEKLSLKEAIKKHFNDIDYVPDEQVNRPDVGEDGGERPGGRPRGTTEVERGERDPGTVQPADGRGRTEGDNRIESSEVKPVGEGVFGKIYDQFRGRAKDAINFLLKNKGGDLLGVFNRPDVGDIDLVWGSKDANNGLEHIIEKHIVKQNDFRDTDELADVLDDVISNGDIIREKWDKVTLEKDGYKVVISKNVRDSKGNILREKNWVVTAFDSVRSKKEKTSPATTLVTPDSVNESRAVTLEEVSESKDNAEVSEKQESGPKFTGDVVAFAEDVVKSHEIDREAAKADPSPTEGQKKAGNFPMGHVNVQGFDITIETARGEVREGKDENGKPFSNTMNHHYGYFKRTEGHDGDKIDVFIGNNPNSETVFVIDQVNPETGEFDESKVTLGFTSREEAKDAYMSNYEAGWEGFSAITEVGVEEFRKWLYDGAKQRKPFSEYASKVVERNEKRRKRQNKRPKSGESQGKDVPLQGSLFTFEQQEHGSNEDGGTDHSRTEPGREKLPETVQVGTGTPAENATRDREGKRRNVRKRRGEPGSRPGYDVNKSYTNEEIHEIVSSVTEVKDGKIEVTGEITDDIKTIASRYVSGGIAKEGRGILDEYYTDSKIVEVVGDLISKYFPENKRIRVLEPSVGTGNFLQAIPQGKQDVVTFEINETTAKIAKIFHPNAEVNLRSFETEFIDDAGKKKPMPAPYDLVLGNPPYGEHRGVYRGLGEESGIAKYEDYFVKRGLDVLNEGGILAMVLPSGWMNRHKRESGYTIENAYRLPSGAFKGTEIGTDIVILRKQTGHAAADEHNWFEKHPGNVLGEVKERSNRFGRMEEYIEGDIDDALERIRQNEARQVAGKLDIEPTPDNLNDIANAIDETGSEEKAEKLVKATREPVKRTTRATIKKDKLKTTYSKGDNVVPASLQFPHEFTSGEVDAFRDANYDGTLRNPGKHKAHASYHAGRWVHDFYYAEGNIYDKLEQLERDKGNITKEQYEKQRKMLEKVLPEKKTIENINISPNTEFVANLMISTPRVQEGKGSLKDIFLLFAAKLPSEAFGDSHYWEVRDYVNNYQVYGTDKNRNQLVRDRRKAAANELFSKFLKEELDDRERSQVVNAFNREYNAIHRPDYSRVPLFCEINENFKGKPLKLTDVQLAGIGMLTVKGVGLLAHEVGFGKTLSGVIAMHEAMTRGFAEKPLIVVPNNSILEQWIETIREIIPESTINNLGNLGVKYDLTDFTVNPGEITIVTYAGFKALGFKPDTYDRLSGKFEYITDELKKHKSAREQEIEKAKRARTKGKMMRGATYNFEDFGFDFMTFDEVHNANHIVGKVKLDKKVASDFRSQNQRTSDLGIKTWLASQYLQEQNNGRNVVLLSATPFTNKPLEYYSILSLVANKTLERMGFFRVDQFFETFMEADNDLEIKADGRPVQKTNVRRFRNNGLFQQLLGEFIDIKGEEDNPDLQRPERFNKEYVVTQNDLTAETMAVIQDLLTDNETVLQGITHARAAAFSPYALDFCPERPKNHVEFVKNSPKIDATVRLVERNRKDNPGAGQIIYSELGIEFFPMIRDYLVKESKFNPKEVAIITGATSATQRAKIQTDFNNGVIKVVIGSPAIKEGMNLQANTTDMYILSLPYNFTQLRQVEGRGWRQGNKWENIRINYMLTDDSSDVFMLQRLQVKQGLYNEAMKEGAETVDVSDIDTGELKTALIKDPDVRAEIELMIEKERLETEKTRIQSDLAFVNRKYEQYNKQKEKVEKERVYLADARNLAKESGFWARQVERYEKDFEKAERDLDAERQKLAEKGVKVDDIINQEQQAKTRIADIEAQIEGLKDRHDELAEKYRKENQSKATDRENAVERYVQERAEENKTFYNLKQEPGEDASGHGADLEGEAMFRVTREKGARQREVDQVSLKAIETVLEKAGIPVEYVTDEEAVKKYAEARKKATAPETAYSLSEKGDHHTVVSSADGAKILKSLDDLKEKLLNLSGKQKTFIGDVGRALGAKQAIGRSQYATFETKSGKIVTIRLSNHNVTVSNFDDVGRKEGISIVITPKKNLGITNDGDAHIVEFYYNELKLRRAEGKPLAEIITSIQQALYSGEYKDTTGLAEVEEVNARNVQFHTGWHGSPHEFDRFSTDYMGTGEGAQAYGWGLYFTDKEGIGRQYARKLGLGAIKNLNVNGISLYENGEPTNYDYRVQGEHLAMLQEQLFANEQLFDERLSPDEMLEGVQEWFDNEINNAKEEAKDDDYYNDYVEVLEKHRPETLSDIKLERNKDRNLYKVKIHGDKTIDELNFMRWDKPLWNTENAVRVIKNQLEAEGYTVIESSEVYLKGIQRRGEYTDFSIHENQSGEKVYKALTGLLGSDKEASLFLLRAGIDGIQYPTEFLSKGEQEDSYNYVVFDESALEIDEHIRFFTRPGHVVDGKRGKPIVYGWLEGGKVYLVKERVNPETPIHEYSHLWDIALEKNNPLLWRHGLELFKQTGLWGEIVNDPNYSYLNNDSQVASEVKARLTGKEGAEVFARMQRDAKETGDMTLFAKATRLINDIKNWLKDAWYWLVDTMTPWRAEDIRRVTIDDLVNMTIADMVKGKSLDGVEARDGLTDYTRFRVEEDPAGFEVEEKMDGMIERPRYVAGMSMAEFARQMVEYNEKTRNMVNVTLGIPRPPTLNSTMPAVDVAFVMDAFNSQKNGVLREVHKEMAKISEQFTTFIDRGRPLEKLLQLMEENGAKLTDDTNAYFDFITSAARGTSLINEYEKTRIEPLQETLRKVAKVLDTTRDGKETTGEYRWNVVDEGTGEVINDKPVSTYDKISLYLQARDIVEADMLQGVADRGAKGFENNVRDANGKGVTPDAYIAEFEAAVDKKLIAEVWDRVRAVNKWALDLQYKHGMIDAETYHEYTSGKREYYVPQRGWRERDLNEGKFYYVTDPGETPNNPFNAALIKARGRQTLGGDPLAYMQSIGESSVMAAMKNQTKQKFLKFAEDNADFARAHDFFGFKQVYYVTTGKLDENMNMIYERTYERPAEEYFERDKEIYKAIRGLQEQREQATLNYNTGKIKKAAHERLMTRLAQRERNAYNNLHVKHVDSEASRIAQLTAAERGQHNVVVLRDGKEYEIVFGKHYSGERVANVLNRNFGKPDPADVKFQQRVKENTRKATRFMSAMMTQYNPTFAARNFVRDFGIASVGHTLEFGVGYQLQFLKNATDPRLQAAVWRYAFAEQFKTGKEFKAGEGNKYDRYLKEFFEDGAQTGWSFLKDIEQLRTDMKRAITPTAKDVVLHGRFGVINAGGFRSLFGTLTEASELITRFSTYVTSREQKNADGTPKYSRVRAAMHSKEASVNFDRKGTQRDFTMAYSFFNANIQGSNKIFRMVRDPRVRKLMIGTASLLMAGGVLQAMLTPDPGDDDEREWTEWELMNNLCMGKLKVELPQGLRAFWGFGVQAGLAYRGKKGVSEALLDGTKYFFGEIIPEQLIFWMNGIELDEKTEKIKFNATMAARGIAPTAIQPLYDVWQNTNFMGGTSYRTEFTNATKDTQAEHSLGKRNVSDGARFVSELLWVWGGGDTKDRGRLKKDDTKVVAGIFDINPSIIETLVSGYSAGTGKFVLDMFTLGSQILDPEKEVDVSGMAIANAFWKQPREYSQLERKLWTLRDKTDFFKIQFNEYKKNNPERYMRITSFHREHGDMLRYDPGAFYSRLERFGTDENKMFGLVQQSEQLQKRVEAGLIDGKAAELEVEVLLGKIKELQ